MYNKFYQDELTFLREQGTEFARAYPKIAHMLSETSADPDVERLLEGFAFLTGRIRQKLDGELSELTGSLIGLLWPHYLRPVPSMTILQFDAARRALAETKIIARGTEIESTPVDGTRCRFRTCYDTTVYPFTLQEVELAVPLSQPAHLRLGFAITGGADINQLLLNNLRLFLNGEPKITYPLFLLLSQYVTGVTFRAKHAARVGRQIGFGPEAVNPVGFADDEALLPYPASSFPGYRLLQEYFALPEKFLFVDLGHLEALARLEIEEQFEIVFEFSRRPGDALRVKRENLRLFCTPAVNLFNSRTDPLRVEQEKTEYLLRPQGSDRTHYEIFSVDNVVGWEQGTSEKREYQPFFSFKHSLGPANQTTEYYQTEIRPAIVGRGTDTYISFVTGEQSGVTPSTQTISVGITASNRDLAEKLRVGDLTAHTADSPAFADFANIVRVTPTISPPLTGGVYWRLISHLSLNYLSLLNPDNLRGILELYNFQALYDRQAARTNELRLNGIKKVAAAPDSYLRRGSLLRGLAIAMEIDEDSFAGAGDMYMFASVLNQFFNLYVTMNSYSRLTVKGTRSGEVFSWPPQMGAQSLL
jgi:type VI secretion system protein ImpG